MILVLWLCVYFGSLFARWNCNAATALWKTMPVNFLSKFYKVLLHMVRRERTNERAEGDRSPWPCLASAKRRAETKTWKIMSGAYTRHKECFRSIRSGWCYFLASTLSYTFCVYVFLLRPWPLQPIASFIRSCTIFSSRFLASSCKN